MSGFRVESLILQPLRGDTGITPTHSPPRIIYIMKQQSYAGSGVSISTNHGFASGFKCPLVHTFQSSLKNLNEFNIKILQYPYKCTLVYSLSPSQLSFRFQYEMILFSFHPRFSIWLLGIHLHLRSLAVTWKPVQACRAS